MTPIAALEHIWKRFGPVQALSDLSLAFEPGRTHALVGENGAGKTTIVKILSGVIQPDTGSVRIDGEPLRLNPAQAIARGVATIFQDRALIPQLTVAENICLGRESTRAHVWLRVRDRKRNARAALRRVGAGVPTDIPVGRLSAGVQQLVAIAKALNQDAKLIVLDEPTAALNEGEANHLFGLVDEMKQSGIAILYITHRLREVSRIADVVTVLKDGVVQGTMSRSETTEERMVALMIGRTLGDYFPKLQRPRATSLLRVHDLGTADGALSGVSLGMAKGEILGVGGLEGSGKSLLAATIGGAMPIARGSMELDGRRIRLRSVSDAIRSGIVYIPPDRRHSAVFPNLQVGESITLASLRRLSRGGMVAARRQRETASALIADLGIKGTSRQLLSTLSGGNQQKAILARALCTTPRLMVVDEPTAGVDVGSRAEIYRLLGDLARDGLGILLVSSDVTELLGFAHRVIVLREGVIERTFDHGSVTEEQLLLAALPR